MIRLDFDLTPFIGRERERADLRAMLAEKRLVTVAGPGGTGKTRLAVEVANELSYSFPAGVRFVDLAPVEDGAGVADAIVGAQSSEHPSAGTRALVVVDNCEHVHAAAADAILSLLRASPGTSVLATSRERLGVAGEAVMPLEPLGVPAANAVLAEIAESEAVRLFVDRARLADPRFEITPAIAGDVAALCREVDGLPLAIELVAPYMRALAPADALSRIKELGLQGVPGDDTRARRQSTLAAAIEWSYRLLSDDERRFLAALAVFSGRFTLEAAQHVARAAEIGSDRAVDLVIALVDKSLVRVHRAHDGTWYTLLEMVRSFAWGTVEQIDDDTLRFERDGEVWHIGRGASRFVLRDSKGLRYLRRLLDSPGLEVSAASLASPHAEVTSAPIEAIDDEARAAYRRRLEDLDDEIKTAEALEDDARVGRATAEREALIAELGRSVGLGGRIRRQVAEAERARTSVTKALRAAIDKIGEHDAELAAHLTRTVRTGAYCGYFPGK